MHSSVTNFGNPAALGRTYAFCIFCIVLMVLEVAIWPYTFTPLGTVLAALVTQIYLGHRQVYRYAAKLSPD